jgi:hypothetical protein
MTRAITLVAIGGIVTALVCLPLAATLSHRAGGWSWSGLDHISWFDDDDDADNNADTDDNDNDSGRDQALSGGNGGPVEAREFAWNGADTLRLDIAANLHYQPAPQWRLSIRGPRRVLDRISVDGSRIGLKRPYHHRAGALEIELSGPALRDLTLNGSGKLVLEHLRQDALTVAIHGSGTVRASGSVDSLKLDIMGSGDALLEQLAARSSRIFIAGSGSADIAPIDEADIFIAGSGDVRLHTHPKHLDSKVAGSGQVIELAQGQAT